MRKNIFKAIAYLHAVNEAEVSISEWDKVCRAKELLESGVSADLEKNLDKGIKDAKHTTDMLKEARELPTETWHDRFDI